MNIPLGAFKTSHEKKEQTNAKKPLNTDFFAFAMVGDHGFEPWKS